MKNKIRYALWACAMLSMSLPVAAQAQTVAAVNAKLDSLLGDHTGFAEEFKNLQQNIADGETFAQEYEFPVKITVDGTDVSFDMPRAFADAYNTIVTPEIVDVVKNQKYKDLMVSSDGVMFGSGQLWIAAYCLDGENCTSISWGIAAINHGQP